MLQNNTEQGRSQPPAENRQASISEDKGQPPATAEARSGRRRWKRYAVGVFFSVIWSSAFIAGKVVVMEMGPFATLFYRFTLTVLVLLLFCGKKLLGPEGRQAMLPGLLLGLLNNVVYLGLNFSALRYLAASWVVIVVSCAPFMTMAMAALRGQESFDKRKLLGLTVAFAGVVVMVGITGLHEGAGLGLGMAIAATLSFSAGAVLFRGKYDALPLLALNFWMTLCGMLCFAPAAFMTPANPLHITWPALAALLWLVVVSLAGMALWLLLIRTQGPSMAASYNMLNPLSGLALSALLLGTAIGVQDVVGAAAIVAGLYVALRPGHAPQMAQK
ncbi:DMT family transporter [Desulfovibrio sp. 86]|nr:DMT family transporter [Desulfovibrio sp. 86]